MEIIKKYNELCNEKIQNDEEIASYASTLNEQIDNLHMIRINQSVIKIILHPVKVIRNNKQLKKLTNIRDDFEKLCNTNLVRFMEEESGSIEQDLIQAMNSTKPKMLKRFIKNNPIKDNPR